LFVILYVLVTAVLYIAAGYFFGRCLIYAPLAREAVDVGCLEAASGVLEALLDDGVGPPAERAADGDNGAVESVAPDERFLAEEHLPPEWLARYPIASVCRSVVEASVQVMQLEVGQYRERLAQVDSQVRQCVRRADADKLEAAVEELRALTSEWIEWQEEASLLLLKRGSTTGDLSHVRDRLDEVLAAQARRFEAASGDLDMYDFKASPLIGARRLVIEVRKLTDLAHTLRDCMQELHLMILAREGRLENVEHTLQIDSLTGLRNRTGIERFVRDWWRVDGRRIRRASVAMLDFDRFTATLERCGPQVTDELIVTVGRMIDEQLRKNGGPEWCGRCAGQRYFIFWPDTGPQAATSVVERIRQTVANTRFELTNGALAVTLSAAVTEVLPDDTSRTLFKRLNGAVAAAKQAGRNRTLLCNGEELLDVRAPEFDVRGLVAHLRT
jgi:diguanylate cyclase (GGDEF)-like protein